MYVCVCVAWKGPGHFSRPSLEPSPWWARDSSISLEFSGGSFRYNIHIIGTRVTRRSTVLKIHVGRACVFLGERQKSIHHCVVSSRVRQGTNLSERAPLRTTGATRPSSISDLATIAPTATGILPPPYLTRVRTYVK